MPDAASVNVFRFERQSGDVDLLPEVIHDLFHHVTESDFAVRRMDVQRVGRVLRVIVGHDSGIKVYTYEVNFL